MSRADILHQAGDDQAEQPGRLGECEAVGGAAEDFEALAGVVGDLSRAEVDALLAQGASTVDVEKRKAVGDRLKPP